MSDSILFLKNPSINSINVDGTVNSPRAMKAWFDEIVNYHKFETWEPTFGIDAGTFDGTPEVSTAHFGIRGQGLSSYWELRLKFQFKVFSAATSSEVTLTLPNAINTLTNYAGSHAYRHDASEEVVPGIWFGRNNDTLVFKNADGSDFNHTRTWQVNVTHLFLST